MNTDEFQGQVIVRVDVAPRGSHPLTPPGISHLPGPGQFYVSSALNALMRATPASELRDRFSGVQVGVIDSSALPSPSDLVIIEGDRPSTLSRVPGAGSISAFATSSSNGGPDSLGTTGLEIVLGILGLVLLVPVLVFVGTATRLSAARRARAQRYASMRLAAGKTTLRTSGTHRGDRSVSRLADEVSRSAFGAFFLVEPALVHIPFAGVLALSRG